MNPTSNQAYNDQYAVAQNYTAGLAGTDAGAYDDWGGLYQPVSVRGGRGIEEGMHCKTPN